MGHVWQERARCAPAQRGVCSGPRSLPRGVRWLSSTENTPPPGSCRACRLPTPGLRDMDPCVCNRLAPESVWVLLGPGVTRWKLGVGVVVLGGSKSIPQPLFMPRRCLRVMSPSLRTRFSSNNPKRPLWSFFTHTAGTRHPGVLPPKKGRINQKLWEAEKAGKILTRKHFTNLSPAGSCPPLGNAKNATVHGVQPAWATCHQCDLWQRT